MRKKILYKKDNSDDTNDNDDDNDAFVGVCGDHVHQHVGEDAHLAVLIFAVLSTATRTVRLPTTPTDRKARKKVNILKTIRVLQVSEVLKFKSGCQPP